MGKSAVVTHGNITALILRRMSDRNVPEAGDRGFEQTAALGLVSAFPVARWRGCGHRRRKHPSDRPLFSAVPKVKTHDHGRHWEVDPCPQLLVYLAAAGIIPDQRCRCPQIVFPDGIDRRAWRLCFVKTLALVKTFVAEGQDRTWRRELRRHVRTRLMSPCGEGSQPAAARADAPPGRPRSSEVVQCTGPK